MALEANLTLTPEDAVRFFERKGEVISWDHTDTWRGDNVHGFTVAKATSLDVLRTIRAEVSRAINEGQTFADFKKRLRPRLEDLGWWGRKEVLDGDTGEVTQAQLGSVRRLRTIYQTNVQTAYMAGRYKRFLDNVADRPYWRYVAVMDGRTRPEHAALNGKVWRWDDPVWEVIWPPNGWGCRCRVVALTEAEFKALGVTLESGADAIETVKVPIGREGESVDVQVVRYVDANGRDKFFRPDPGWDYNPGDEWARYDPAGFKGEDTGAAALTPTSSAGVIRAIDGLPTWTDAGRPDLRDPALPRLPAPELLPLASDRETAVAMITDALLRGQERREVATPVESVWITPELLPHIVQKAGDGRERYANFIVPTLESPFEVWLTPYSDGTYRKRYIGLFTGLADLLVIVRENRDSTLYWEVYNVMQSASKALNKLRAGTLLFGKDVTSGP